jgi:hypothetical protein
MVEKKNSHTRTTLNLKNKTMENDKADFISKFLQIEQWAYRGRHLVEIMDRDKMKFVCKRIRYDLEELEEVLGKEVKK